MLWMMIKHFKSDPERANLLYTRKFLLLQMKGNDLQGYLTQWDKMLFELGSKRPPKAMLKMLFVMNTERCSVMADVYKRYREVPAGHGERSYAYLITKARTILNDTRREKMYAAEQAAAGIIIPGMPAHGTKGQKGKKGEGKSKDPGGKDKKKGIGKGDSAPKWNEGGTKPHMDICRGYMAGTCNLGFGCKWNHCKAIKDERLAKGYGQGKLGKGKGKGKKGKGKSAAPQRRLGKVQCEFAVNGKKTAPVRMATHAGTNTRGLARPSARHHPKLRKPRMHWRLRHPRRC